jgi:hypothetical protein
MGFSSRISWAYGWALGGKCLWTQVKLLLLLLLLPPLVSVAVPEQLLVLRERAGS